MRGIEDSNGYEAYRRLQTDFVPHSRARTLTLLQLLGSWPTFNYKEGLAIQTSKLETAITEYENISGTVLDAKDRIAPLMR